MTTTNYNGASGMCYYVQGPFVPNTVPQANSSLSCSQMNSNTSIPAPPPQQMYQGNTFVQQQNTTSGILITPIANPGLQYNNQYFIQQQQQLQQQQQQVSAFSQQQSPPLQKTGFHIIQNISDQNAFSQQQLSPPQIQQNNYLQPQPSASSSNIQPNPTANTQHISPPAPVNGQQQQPFIEQMFPSTGSNIIHSDPSFNNPQMNLSPLPQQFHCASYPLQLPSHLYPYNQPSQMLQQPQPQQNHVNNPQYQQVIAQQIYNNQYLPQQQPQLPPQNQTYQQYTDSTSPPPAAGPQSKPPQVKSRPQKSTAASVSLLTRKNTVIQHIKTDNNGNKTYFVKYGYKLCSDPFSCDKTEDKDHTTKYLHVCEEGKDCPRLNDKSHWKKWIHFDLEDCPNGDSCTELTDPKHRMTYHHKGYPDFLPSCGSHACMDRSDEHCKKYQHESPQVLPEITVLNT